MEFFLYYVIVLSVSFCLQGPEHSSARPERFLQMSNDDPDHIPVCWHVPFTSWLKSVDINLCLNSCPPRIWSFRASLELWLYITLTEVKPEQFMIWLMILSATLANTPGCSLKSWHYTSFLADCWFRIIFKPFFMVYNLAVVVVEFDSCSWIVTQNSCSLLAINTFNCLIF